jgi:alkylation response protein AidB-like acyl-CoA dehydrogenase
MDFTLTEELQMLKEAVRRFIDREVIPLEREFSYMVKIVCTEMASRVVDRSIQVHGGLGLTKELPLEWWYRQLRSLRITEGAREVLRWRLAQHLIKSHNS